MPDANINRPEWEKGSWGEAFGRRAMRLGPHAGASELGASLYELDPGGAVSPFHAHHANEELLLVLSGRPALRTQGGVRRLEPGDVVAFPRGLSGAHRIFNPSEDVVRVLVVSTTNLPEIAEYPDTGATLVVPAPGKGHAFPAGADEPRADLVIRAMEAAREHD